MECAQLLQGRSMIVLCVLTGKARGQGEKKEKSGFQASSLDCIRWELGSQKSQVLGG